MQAILSDIQPGGGSGDEPYSLPADVEFVFVLAGELEMTIAGEPVTLGPGDAFTFPATAERTFRAASGPGPTQVLWVFSPALPDAAGLPLEPDRYGITTAASGAADAAGTGGSGAAAGTE